MSDIEFAYCSRKRAENQKETLKLVFRLVREHATRILYESVTLIQSRAYTWTFRRCSRKEKSACELIFCGLSETTIVAGKKIGRAPYFATSIPPCADSLAPARCPGGTQE